MAFCFSFPSDGERGFFMISDQLMGQISLRHVNVLLARAFCQVSYQERFSLSDAEWDALFSAMVPVNLVTDLDKLYSIWLGSRRKTVSKTKSLASRMLNKWREHSVLVPHIDILERAVERFKNNDYISCSGLLFSRIEGILRTHHTSLGTQSYPSPKNLAESAVVSKIENKRSLLPTFLHLQNVYFADFAIFALQCIQAQVAMVLPLRRSSIKKLRSSGFITSCLTFFFLRRGKSSEVSTGFNCS